MPRSIPGQPERREAAMEFTEDAFQEMIRQGTDGPTVAKADEIGLEPEPKVIVEDEPGDRTGRVLERMGEPEVIVEDDKKIVIDDDRLGKALSTIERLQADIDVLKRPRVADDTRGSERPAASSKMKEVAPGAFLPEDERLWPINLSDEIVKGIGLDPGEKAQGQQMGSITRGLSILANLLVQEVMGRYVPVYVDDTFNRRVETREKGAAEETLFFDSFSDLKDKRDLMDVVERRIQAEITGGSRTYTKRTDYLNDLAKETRTRVATLKGQSYEDYLASVRTERGTSARSGRSRAITTSGARGGRRGGGVSDMDDLIDNRG